MIVHVLNTELKVIGKPIEDYHSLVWSERYSEVGDFELELPIEYALDSSLVFGNFLYIGSSDKLMVIEDIKPSFGEEKTSLLIKGQSAESILKRRVLLDPINVSGFAESTIYNLVNDNVTGPGNADRDISLFNNTFPGVSTTEIFEEQLEMQTVYEAVKTICKSTDLGFKVIKSAEELEFFVYKGEDRSYTQSTNPYVVFSDNFDNVIATSFYESEKDKINIVLVTTEDRVLALRRVFIWEEGAAEPTGLDRSETVLEAGIERNLGRPEPAPLDIVPSDILTGIYITVNPVLGIPSISLVPPDILDGIYITVNPALGIPSVLSESTEPPEPIEPYPPDPLAGPTIGIAGQDNLAAIGITTAPTIDGYGGRHFLSPISATANPRIYIPVIGVIINTHILTAIDIITVVDIPVTSLFINIDKLEAIGITTTPIIDEYTLPPLSDEEVLAIITTRGRQVIKENKSVGLFEGDFDIQENFEYGVDFFMGDIVQCNLEGKNVKARIIELVRSYSTEGEKSYVAMDFII